LHSEREEFSFSRSLIPRKSLYLLGGMLIALQPPATSEENYLSPREIGWEELCAAVIREIDSERLRILAAVVDHELSRRKRSNATLRGTKLERIT
jgi:hypothetical protein